MYNPVELIIKKRSGERLSTEELSFFVNSYLSGNIDEYQMSAMLMAIFFQGMEVEEVQTFTDIYIKSGKQITFPATMNTVDKHSTGGVGDKITIMLAPIVAACGAKIPMISGRGLGHTGGTLDKLESIPGFRTNFEEADFKRMIAENNLCIISQSEDLVPADRRIYALRDVTGTVESLPLITASIMSKKLAEGAQNLVIDLKVGTGAFMKTMENAEKLGTLLKATGEKFGQKVTVVFTNMDAPLGNYIGNGLEILECVEYLRGKKAPDIHEITLNLAREMLLLAKITDDPAKAEEMIEEVIANGKAMDFFRKFVAAQGGDPAICDNTDLLPQGKIQVPIIADRSGWISGFNSQAIGYALVDLGAGRRILSSKLDYAAGAYLPVKIGDEITKGNEIGKVYCKNQVEGEKAAIEIMKNIQISTTKIESPKLIKKIVR